MMQVLGTVLLFFGLVAIFASANAASAVKGAKQNSAKVSKTVKNGKSNSAKLAPHIIGGTNVTLGQFPWQAFIITDNTKFCGGSLVLANWVLTAATCIGVRHIVSLGATFAMEERNLAKAPIVMGSLETYVYSEEGATDESEIVDIGLIKLVANVLPAKEIQIISLPSLADIAETYDGVIGRASGFGGIRGNDVVGLEDGVLQYTELEVITNTECATLRGVAEIGDNLLCAGAPGKGACIGDHGGPLVYKKVKQWVQIGVIAANGPECETIPALFERIDEKALEWMSAVTEQDMYGLPINKKRTTTTPPTTTSKPPDCSLVNIDDLCFKPPTYNKFLPTLTSTACENLATNILPFNTYVMHKFAHRNTFASKLGDNFNLFSAKIKRDLGKQACFVNCYLKEREVIQAGTDFVDEEKLIEFLAATQKGWNETIRDVTHKCYNLINAYRPVKYLNKAVYCDARPLFILQCIQKTLYDSYAVQDTKPACVQSVKNLKTCMMDVFDPYPLEMYKKKLQRMKARSKITRKEATLKS